MSPRAWLRHRLGKGCRLSFQFSLFIPFVTGTRRNASGKGELVAAGHVMHPGGGWGGCEQERHLQEISHAHDLGELFGTKQQGSSAGVKRDDTAIADADDEHHERGRAQRCSDRLPGVYDYARWC